MQQKEKSAGSIWRRWDPHIHTPGTVLNDQFGDEAAWEDFLQRIETSNPQIEVLGITDYYSLDNYEKARAYRNDGRMPNVGLLFPNIELRYAIGTPKGTPINFHLMVSPDDIEHGVQLKRFLRKLTFKAGDDEYGCSHNEIIRLGRHHTGKHLDDRAAFTAGANQFKVSPDQFLKEWADSPWMQKNALIAIAAGSGDGTSGLQRDDSLAALRQKLERSAHVIFSSNPKDRDFWLGNGAVSVEELAKTYHGRKPCLHGSDAHDPEDVGAPALDRFTWIKGDAIFESLRQVCMEPELRVIVAPTPPSGAFSSQTIKSIVIANADWFIDRELPLNSGLIGVIGGRGSGKTALADMIAAGAHALLPHLTKTSFVKRAREPVNLLGDTSATLNWKDGKRTTVALRDLESEEPNEVPRVQYLSQQFVEQLCSADGATDALIREIERVIFMVHSQEKRMGTEDFRELLDMHASRGRQRRAGHERAIAETGDKMGAERDKQDAVPEAQKRRAGLEIKIDQDKTERTKLITEDAKAHAQDLEKVSAAADTLRGQIEQARRRLEALHVLTDDVKAFREWRKENEFVDFKEKHTATDLKDSEWAAFRTDYVGDVDQIISSVKTATIKQIKRLSGLGIDREDDSGKTQVTDAGEPLKSTKSLIPRDTSLTDLPLSVLEKEEARLRSLISADEEKRTAYKKLSGRIAAAHTQISNLDKAIAVGHAAEKKIGDLIAARNRSYQGVFEGIEAEEKALTELYSPLSEHLGHSGGALGKLTFSIRRNVDLAAWAKKGEALLDLRKAGDFRGRGELNATAEALLLEAWRTGSAEDVAKAMATFRTQHDENLRSGAPVKKTDKARYRAWAGEVSRWLYSTDHIRVSYGVQHEGVDIETLSPGTRGIVLLLLYLAIDTEDDRPLIIDQPEENLDPKSIFDELVELFRQTKLRRQIIIVTHNANLVVNTDADQVIVAQCGQLHPSKLPEIRYTCGGLENADIRAHVCNILEGGEEAFRERAKRLRVDVTTA